MDIETHRVVGVVTARAALDVRELNRRVKGKNQTVMLSTGRLEKVAFATPSHILMKVCPELGLDDICPYRGLLSFTEEEAQLFYGKDKLISKLEDSLLKNPCFLAVVGSSGSGKSSVIQAGLLPRMNRRLCSESKESKPIKARPTNHPVQALLSELSFVLYGERGVHVTRNRRELRNEIKETIRARSRKTVIFIDQFEEMFSSSSLEQEEFIDILIDLIDENHKITLIIAIRSDFYSDLLNSSLSSFLEYAQVNVLKTSLEEIEDAILKPAEKVGLRIEPGLTRLITDDLREATQNPLPLLQFTLTRLWEVEHTSNLLTSDCYLQIGRVTGALTTWADNVYYSFSEIEKQIARQLFTKLVRCGSGDVPDTRTRLKASAMRSYSVDLPKFNYVLEKLIGSRLIVSYKDEDDGHEYIEIVHDFLVQEWQLLRYWITESRETLLQRDKIELAAEEWKNKNKSRDYLWQGNLLAKAVRFNKQYGDELSLSSISQEFLASSVSRRYRNLIKNVFIGLLAPLTLTGILGFQIRKELRLGQYWDVINAHSEENPATSAVLSNALEKLHEAGKSFSDIRLETATISDVTLSSSDFKLADMQNISIDRVDFQNADLRAADMKSASVDKVNFQNADLNGINLAESQLTEVNLSYADIRRADLTGSSLARVRIVDADLVRANLTNASVSYSDLRNSNLSSAYLSGTSFYQTDFRQAKLNNSKLCSTTFVYARFERSSMQNALFIGSDLRNANFNSSDLSNANLTDANIDNVDFRGAKGLSFSQIRAARNWQLAIYDDDFRTGLISYQASNEEDSDNNASSSLLICGKPEF
ncbi:pentapeptide repeat-containing protein [Leptolyngbya cf. ectocarpi LEGE 11479]|uniref:Pentapeptide repeat-containing protein n=1 Tax=Leptolyngbya cf. ectocarpi LEGE 11479 TaxID=1828722 RepID=A0A928ZVV0_LEPEC|nr:pentapeptide repeat-containing protein [Leptolyngbya cf. ectocarpi LEGE 11479]